MKTLPVINPRTGTEHSSRQHDGRHDDPHNGQVGDPVRDQTTEEREKAQSILLLLSCGSGDKDADVVRAFHVAVEHHTAETVRLAVQRFLRGEVEGVNPAFRPTPMQLATQCRKISALYDPPKPIHQQPTNAPKLDSPEAAHASQVKRERALSEDERAAIIQRVRRQAAGQRGDSDTDAEQQRTSQTVRPLRLRSTPAPAEPQQVQSITVSNPDALLAALDRRSAGRCRVDDEVDAGATSPTINPASTSTSGTPDSRSGASLPSDADAHSGTQSSGGQSASPFPDASASTQSACQTSHLSRHSFHPSIKGGSDG